MSTLNSKTERTTRHPARRTYASLESAWGFQHEPELSRKTTCVSICPMGKRSFWRHVDSSRPASRDALYEEMGL